MACLAGLRLACFVPACFAGDDERPTAPLTLPSSINVSIFEQDRRHLSRHERSKEFSIFPLSKCLVSAESVLFFSRSPVCFFSFFPTSRDSVPQNFPAAQGLGKGFRLADRRAVEDSLRVYAYKAAASPTLPYPPPLLVDDGQTAEK